MKELIRSPKYLAAAQGEGCVNCGTNDGTVVAAYYQGLRSQAFGKVTGIKPHDVLVADLCARCHRKFDNYMTSPFEEKYMRGIDHSEQFMFAVLMTMIRRIKQGVIKVPGHEPE